MSFQSNQGNVVGPASATDTKIPAFNGTSGKLIKNTAVGINGAGLDNIVATSASLSTINTFSLPASNFVGLTDSQTLTNKTLTSPVVNQFGTASGLGAAWTAWTPTVTAGSGTFTSATGAGRYMQIGKTIIYQCACTITTVGTGTGCVFTLPVTAQSGTGLIGSAREDATTGNMGAIKLASTTTGSVLRYDNGNIASGGNGSIVRCSGTYEAA